jgi:hypothetical protein
MKKCKQCKIEKSESEYYKHKGCKNGILPICKNCKLEKCKKYAASADGKKSKKSYYNSNKHKINERNNQYRKKNLDKIIKTQKAYRENNKDKLSKKNKLWAKNNKEHIKAYQKKYRLDNKEKTKNKYKLFYANNKTKIRLKCDKWFEKNKIKYLSWRRNYDRERRKKIDVKISNNVSRRIHESLKNKKGGRNWEKLVGYSIKQLMNHLELKFKPGMSWENYGLHGWHIDHVIPRSHFKITDYNCSGFKKCWNISNLQPLWARENLIKGNKIQ